MRYEWLVNRGQPVIGAVIGVAAALFGLASVDGLGPLARPEFGRITSLPISVYLVGALGLGAVVVSRRHQWAGLVIFFAWLPFEDLVRKFAGNDLRVYFVKDVLLLVALAGLAPALTGCWRRPLGQLWAPTMLVLTIALVYSIPSALNGISVPLVGLHQKFLFAALFPVGVLLARHPKRLEQTMLFLAVLSAAVCFVGILQVLLGEQFLNPQVADPYLQHLTVVKQVGREFAPVLRPSGPFADVSRFASMTIVSILIGFCALRLSSSAARRRLAVLCILVSLAGAFASGSRTSLLIGLPLAIFGAITSSQRRGRIRRSLALGGAAILAVTMVGGTVAETSSTTAKFYETTLNPVDENFELGERVGYYAVDAIRGFSVSGFVGRGTGDQSTGRRYVGATDENSVTIESGWAGLAIEWGVLGFVAWVVWAGAWMTKAVRLSLRRSNDAAAPIRGLIAVYVVSLLTVQFSLGTGFFENYIANIFFWFLSGVSFSAMTDYQDQTRPAAQERAVAHG